MTHILNITEAKGRALDWSYREAVENNHIHQRPIVPKAKDLRPRRGWSIEDQGQRGACVGYALASLLHWHWMQKGWSFRIRPSKRWIWEGAKETDGIEKIPTTPIEKAGTTVKAGLELLRKHGTLTERELSIRKEKTMLTEGEVELRCNQRVIKAHYRLRNVDEIRKWIAFQGPVAIWIRPDDAFLRASRRNYVLHQYFYPGVRRGHLFLLSGYDQNRFTARNSWGRRWGKSGYAQLSEEYVGRAMEECYGIAV